MKKKIKFEHLIIFCLIIFFAVSITSIYSAGSILPLGYKTLYLKQLMWYIISIILLIIVTKTKNEKIHRYSEYIYFASIFLLIVVLFFGNEVNNTKGWLSLGSLSFQPSEFAKLGIILMICKVLNEYHFKDEKNTKAESKLIFKTFLITLIPSVLAFAEPDTGSVISYFFITFIMLFISGIKRKWFILFLIAMGTFLSLIVLTYVKYSDLFIKIFGNSFYYRIHRLIDWSNTSGMQLENSLIIVGTSGILGHGFNNIPIYFPEPYSDFIFTVFISNFGIIAASLLIILILIFDYSIMKIALTSSRTIDKYLTSGVLASFIYAQIQNISMTVGLLPITGIPLNFISYGGSSLTVSFIMIGLVLNTVKEKNWFRS